MLYVLPVGLAQFKLVRYEHGVSVNMTNRKLAYGFRNDSVAFLNFYFERQTGFFLLQIYTPLTLIVMCSWVVRTGLLVLKKRKESRVLVVVPTRTFFRPFGS